MDKDNIDGGAGVGGVVEAVAEKNYVILSTTLIYPLVNKIVGTEPVLDVDGKPKFHLEQVFHPDGRPKIAIVSDPASKMLVKQPEFIQVPAMRDIVEAVPDGDAEVDGLDFEVRAESGKVIKFHIGKSAFVGLEIAAKKALIEREIEILLAQDAASASNKAPAWTEGLV